MRTILVLLVVLLCSSCTVHISIGCIGAIICNNPQPKSEPERGKGEMQAIWWLTKDGDRECLALYERHYSAWHPLDGRRRKLFVGPGEKIVLRTEPGDAVFVWRKFIDDSGQEGVNCALFRNESEHRSSDLIRQADAIADFLWPDSRHYTSVDAKRIRSTNPGYCFLQAGWRRCGMTKGGLLILERLPQMPTDSKQ